MWDSVAKYLLAVSEMGMKTTVQISFTLIIVYLNSWSCCGDWYIIFVNLYSCILLCIIDCVPLTAIEVLEDSSSSHIVMEYAVEILQALVYDNMKVKCS